MKLEIRIDRAACHGTGECVFRAPASFALDDEDTATLRDSPGDAEDQLLRAARACPHFAIAVRRDGERLV